MFNQNIKKKKLIGPTVGGLRLLNLLSAVEAARNEDEENQHSNGQRYHDHIHGSIQGWTNSLIPDEHHFVSNGTGNIALALFQDCCKKFIQQVGFETLHGGNTIQ